MYSLAGQTIFQIIGANGAPMAMWESYPQSAVPFDGGLIDRALAVRRTKEEFEAEQLQLRKG